MTDNNHTQTEQWTYNNDEFDFEFDITRPDGSYYTSVRYEKHAKEICDAFNELSTLKRTLHEAGKEMPDAGAIANRIRSEHNKHQNLDWAMIAAMKISALFAQKEATVKDLPDDESILSRYPRRYANGVFLVENVHKRRGARWMRSEASAVVASLKSSLSASERFRAQDAMAHIEEANELRARIKDLEQQLTSR